jgi:hypothetical protein
MVKTDQRLDAEGFSGLTPIQFTTLYLGGAYIAAGEKARFSGLALS